MFSKRRVKKPDRSSVSSSSCLTTCQPVWVILSVMSQKGRRTEEIVEEKKEKALTALVGRLSLSADWENGPERGT